MTQLRLFALISLFVGALACSASNPLGLFGYNNIQDALDAVPEGTDTAVAIDTDDDGIVDGIDTNDDGVPDITIDPGDTGGSGGGGGGGTGTIDDPPIRDSGGNCNIVAGSIRVISGEFSGDPAADNLVLSDVAGSDNTINIDLQGNSVKRVIINKLSGGSNRINVLGAVMTQAFCNNSLSGGSNKIVLEGNSAPIVDLMSGTGGGTDGNRFDVLFTPGTNLKFNLSGNDRNCISAPSGTEIDPESTPIGDSRVHTDGSTCL